MLLKRLIVPRLRLKDNRMRAKGSLVERCSIPVICAVLINMTLFGLMPGLTRIVPDKNQFEDVLDPVDVIRIRRPDSSVIKKKKPPKPEKKEMDPLEKRALLTNTVKKKIRLPFEINNKLPIGPQTLSMPEVDSLCPTAPVFSGAVGMYEIDAPLVSISKIPPVYPMQAKRLSIEGWVTVTFLVNESGLVDYIEIVEADPPDMFEQSVINCVSKWCFRPGTIEDIPVRTWAETTIYFELERE